MGPAQAAVTDPPSADPPSVDFGTLQVGTTAEGTVTFTSPSGVPFGTTALELAGSDQLVVTADWCTGASPLATSCAATVRYAPMVSGTHTGALRLTTLTGTTEVPLAGRAQCCQVSLEPGSGTEGDDVPTTVVVTLVRTGPATDPITVAWRTIEGTAGADDFTAVTDGRSTMPAGTTRLDLPVTILPDDVYEDTEHLSVELLAADGAFLATPTVVTATIHDDDVPPPPPPPTPTITATGTEVVEQTGVDTILSVPVRLVQPATSNGSLRVQLGDLSSATAGRDLLLPELTFATTTAGSDMTTAEVRILGDARPEDVETIHLELVTPFGGEVRGEVLVTIHDDDPAADVVTGATGGFTFAPGTGTAGIVAWKRGSPSGWGTLGLTGGSQSSPSRVTTRAAAGGQLTDLTALTVRACTQGAATLRLEIRTTAGTVLYRPLRAGADHWQTLDGVDENPWFVAGGWLTSLADYQSQHPGERVDTVGIAVIGPSSDRVYADRFLVGTTATGPVRHDFEAPRRTKRTVPDGTCETDPLAATGTGSGGGLPGTG